MITDPKTTVSTVRGRDQRAAAVGAEAGFGWRVIFTCRAQRALSRAADPRPRDRRPVANLIDLVLTPCPPLPWEGGGGGTTSH